MTLMRRSTAWGLGAAVVTLATWGYLARLARVPELWAIELKRSLFGWALVELLLAIGVLSVALAREKKIAAFRGIMIGLTLICMVGILEASSAPGLLHWKLALERLLRDDSSITWKFDPDPVLGWKRRLHDKWVSPSIADIERKFSIAPARQVQLTFTYDAYGYRNPRTLPRADVVLIGDSYIEGFNAIDDEVVARKLEERLGRPVESMGITGYGTLQNLIVFDKDAPKLAPKGGGILLLRGQRPIR
jgi:hypothetical protein